MDQISSSGDTSAWDNPGPNRYTIDYPQQPIPTYGPNSSPWFTGQEGTTDQGQWAWVADPAPGNMQPYRPVPLPSPQQTGQYPTYPYTPNETAPDAWPYDQLPQGDQYRYRTAPAQARRSPMLDLLRMMTGR